MKYTIGFLFLILTYNVHAKVGLRLVVPYTIVSDELATDVPNGFCRVTGNVTKNGAPFQNGLIGNYDITHKTSTDSSGKFSLLIPESDSVVFFFSPGNSEIVINPYDFKSQHEVQIDFFVQSNLEIMTVDKPVIYLYSEKDIEAHLTLDFMGDLKFTYPEYDNGWEVRVNADGIQNTKDQKVYPYLFWEGELNALQLDLNESRIEGFLVQKDAVIPFLENQLTALGLNEREQTDFITFWAPRMINSEYCVARFLVDEEYETEIANININPNPDAMRRVYLLFTPLNYPLDAEFIPQKFQPFERSGFTVLEWGGSELKLNRHDG